MGNRLTSAITTPSGALLSSTYNYPTTSHRLSSITGANAKSFSYDNAGNTTGRGSDVFTYNNAGRLANVAANGYSVDATYDAAGHRRKKTIGTAQTLFFYDSDGNLITELGTNSDVTKREYIWLNGQPLTITGIVKQKEVVVDNTDFDFSANGSWSSGTSGTGYYGSNYLQHAPALPPGSQIMDDGAAGTSSTGTWVRMGMAVGDGAYGMSSHTAIGVNSAMLNPVYAWTLPVSSGTYRVYARWPNRIAGLMTASGRAHYKVFHNGGTTDWLADQNNNTATWNYVGTFDFGSQAVITLTADSFSRVIADAVRVVPVSTANDHAHWSAPDTATYEVFARWPSGGAATQVPMSIASSSGTAQFNVSQTSGGAWQSLGTYTFTDVTTQGVNLFTDPEATVLADAVRFVPIASAPPKSVFAYVHNDHLGTPQALTDSSGALNWDATYAPFGEVTNRKNRVENPLRFPGQFADGETKLYQNWHRDYDPVLGRYVESDPIGLRGDINTYTYARENSLRYVDPKGLQAPTDGGIGGDGGGGAVLPSGAPPSACQYYDDQCKKSGKCDTYACNGRKCCESFGDNPFSNCTRKCLIDLDQMECAGLGSDARSTCRIRAHFICYASCFNLPDFSTFPWNKPECQGALGGLGGK